MFKNTGNLDFELKSTENIHSFLSANEAEFDDQNFYKLLNTLIAESSKSKPQLAKDSHISEPYMYNLVNGQKRPTRDTVIKVSFGLNLPLDTSERLLKLAGYGGYYVRHKRDSILKFSLESGHSIAKADELLSEYGLPIISY
ncbi:MAG: helix-turn-helix transcriptional regulator [Defluviitaleaceae bacterium]|nr:helix-turn-helix transcriptional regulator [Defluviitaleaceae bacterium]